MPVEFDLLLPVAQRPPARHPNLFLDNVDAGHHLCDRMLHLQAGIHLQEIKVLVFVEQEFDRPRIDVIHGFGRFDRNTAHCLAQLVVQGRREGLFQQFLMTALERTFTLTQMNDITLCVCQDLDLDMPRALEQFLEIDVAIAERGFRLAPR